MEIKLVTFEHRSNGLAIYVIPESELERTLLQGFWKYGQLVTGNGIADGTGQGFSIRWEHETPADAGRD